MSNYRRNRVEGGCFFFTVNLQDRRSDLLIIHIEALRNAVRAARARYPPADNRRASFVRRRERAIWQRRYWEHTIRDEQDYAAHMDYIHFNPVRHGLAARAADWPFSSFVRCVRLGMYATDWAMRDVGLADTGERR